MKSRHPNIRMIIRFLVMTNYLDPSTWILAKLYSVIAGERIQDDDDSTRVSIRWYIPFLERTVNVLGCDA